MNQYRKRKAAGTVRLVTHKPDRVEIKPADPDNNIDAEYFQPSTVVRIVEKRSDPNTLEVTEHESDITEKSVASQMRAISDNITTLKGQLDDLAELRADIIAIS